MSRPTGGGGRLPLLVVGVFVIVVAIAGWMVWSGRWPIEPEAPRLDMDVDMPSAPTLPRPVPMPDPQPAPLPIPGPRGG
ncbi:MAG: hypothetical protein V4466_08730 [Pseudomonadota bacterium]